MGDQFTELKEQTDVNRGITYCPSMKIYLSGNTHAYADFSYVGKETKMKVQLYIGIFLF